MTLPPLPSGWHWSTVGDVGRLQLGRQRAPKYHEGSNMKSYLRVANVFEDHIDTRDVKSMHFEPVDYERYRLLPGDVLLNEGQTPEFLGRPAMYRGHPRDAAFTNSLIRFQAGPGIDPAWALLVFRHHMHSGRFKQESRITTNIAHLSASRLKTVEFPVPPIGEQLRVVQLLEDHLSRLDAAESYLLGGQARVKALLEAWLRPKLLRQPARPLKELLAQPLSNGRSVPTAEQGFPVLRLTALGDGLINLRERKIGAWSEDEARPFLVEPGDFLLSRGNGSLARVGLGGVVTAVDSPVAFPDTMICVRCDPGLVNAVFLAIAWNSRVVRRQLEAAARTTAGIYKVNQKQLETVQMPVPTLADQAAIAAGFARLREVTTVHQKALVRGRIRGRVLRRALLRAACTGALSTGTAVAAYHEAASV